MLDCDELPLWQCKESRRPALRCSLMLTIDPEAQKKFAVQVVQRLQRAGHEAYWAGGCVRDLLLGRAPKDYDVATSATPSEIRNLFGYRRTLAIGAAFGVITVRGPKGAGNIEVATFRQDLAYSDGRHPDAVVFSSAAEDARRRDFTINGLFYDPLAEQVLDFVGGQEDLKAGLIRAIGQPEQRFAEDKLRMLRAVRFAAGFDFTIEPATFAAIRQMASQITVVSAERIAEEMRRMLTGPKRVRAVNLLLETGLAAAVLPEIVVSDTAARDRLQQSLETLGRLDQPSFPLALAALLHKLVDADAACAVARRWKLSNAESDRCCWLIAHCQTLHNAHTMPWSALQPLLVSPGIEELLALLAASGQQYSEAYQYCRRLLQQPPEILDPPPLLSGEDLRAHGVKPGPVYRELLDRVRAEQLDGRIGTKDEALALVDRRLAELKSTESESRQR